MPAEPPGSAPTTPVLPVADGGTVWPPTPGQAPASGQVLAAPARPSVASVPAEPPGSAPTTPVLPVADGGTVWPPTPGQTPASGQVLAAPARPSVASVPAEPPGSAPTTPVLPVADGGTAWPPTPGQTPASGQVLAAPGQVPVSGWSFVEQFPAPVLSRRRDRRLVWSVVVGAAVVGVATSLVLTLVVGKGDGPKPATAAASVTPTSSARPGVVSESPSDTGSPSPSASAPPVGYELRDDTEGFRIAVPDGWSRSTVDSSYGMAVVSYRSADREHRLQVYQVAEESPAASHELYLSAETPKPDGFRELGLTDLDDGRFTGSRLEYLAGTISGEPDIGTWHVFDERFVAPDGNIYAVASYGPDSDGRGDELAYLTTAVDWFCPPDTVCDTDPAAD
ncbi:hypothetical protein ABTY98_23775 [Streptomyces sp. NPDC096040]|uniref:hypothetical protein n=1 Tax=Streptomyces sp. NPDC096040 TaxID=3155541 RepID=UPI003327B887